jgi:hypothetical protein
VLLEAGIFLRQPRARRVMIVAVALKMDRRRGNLADRLVVEQAFLLRRGAFGARAHSPETQGRLHPRIAAGSWLAPAAPRKGRRNLSLQIDFM